MWCLFDFAEATLLGLLKLVRKMPNYGGVSLAERLPPERNIDLVLMI